MLFRNIKDLRLYSNSSPLQYTELSLPGEPPGTTPNPGLFDGILRALLPTSVADGNHFFLAAQRQQMSAVTNVMEMAIAAIHQPYHI